MVDGGQFAGSCDHRYSSELLRPSIPDESIISGNYLVSRTAMPPAVLCRSKTSLKISS